MKRRTICLAVFAATLFSLAASNEPAVACTGIRIQPKDGSVIVARTLEFAADLRSNVVVIPRATESVGTAPGGKPGLRWKSKYGSVGANGFDLPAIVDGLNEKGLGIGIFYFPGYAKYQEVKEEDGGKALAPWELPVYLLGNCANVKECFRPWEASAWARWSRRTWGMRHPAITSSTMPVGGAWCWNTWPAN